MYFGMVFICFIGDVVVERIGVVATSEIECVCLNKDMKVIVIVLDGVFEFILFISVIKVVMVMSDL